MIRQGINDIIVWVKSGAEIISEIDKVSFSVSKSDSTLVHLFNDWYDYVKNKIDKNIFRFGNFNYTTV